MYKTFFKRFFDIVLSFFGIIILSWLLIFISLAIFINDPGPIIFKQKRIGKNKKIFKIWKFRSMKMSTPSDVPTHMLKNPEQYITKVGRFMRKTSLAWVIIGTKTEKPCGTRVFKHFYRIINHDNCICGSIKAFEC